MKQKLRISKSNAGTVLTGSQQQETNVVFSPSCAVDINKTLFYILNVEIPFGGTF